MKKPATIIIAILAVLLAISVLANVALYQRATQYYTQLNATRLDPLGIGVYSKTMTEPTKSNRNRVVFFGDSRAADWFAPPNLPQFEFINRGIGGETSEQSVGRFDQHVAPLHPHVIVLQVCVNELKTIAMFPNHRDNIVNQCKANLQTIVDKSHQLGATVILTTVFPLGYVPIERRLFWSDEVAVAIDEVNQFIHTLAGEQVLIFDTAEVLADEHGQVKAEYSWDLLHLNESGYTALNQVLREILVTSIN